MTIKENVNLAEYTNFKIGGPAKYFCEVKEIRDIQFALLHAKQNNLTYFILGGGTNLLVSDKGFNGLVIMMMNKSFTFQDLRLITGAGALFDELIQAAADKGLSGLEWAGGLPGTIGGAVRGNAGCFGFEIKDCVFRVTSISKDGEIIERDNEFCEFGYRDSVFKRNGEIIISVELSLKNGKKEEILRERDEKIKYRWNRQPLELPSAGSVFKNCPLDSMPLEIQKGFSEKIKQDPFPVIPAAVLIAALGLAGVSIGGAKISEKHTNFIVNFKNAKAHDVLALINLVKKKVKNDFGVLLEEEIQLVGF